MYCIECGEELPDEAKFCFSCGEKTEIVDAITNQNKSEKKLNKKVIIDENLDDEIIEIKKGSIKLVSPIDEIKKNMKGNVKKNRDYIKLRKTYKNLSENDVEKMISKKNFFDSKRNENGKFKNNFEAETLIGDQIAIDKATNLMWHQSGSTKRMNNSATIYWLNALNDKGYAGFSDWRLPTLEEATSLLKLILRSPSNYQDYIFCATQWFIVTIDRTSSGESWYVDFDVGSVRSSSNYSDDEYYVRPVRSIKDV